MYARLFGRLPGPAPVKVLLAIVLFLVIVVILFLWVFPIIDAMLPIDDSQISAPFSAAVPPAVWIA